MAKQDVLDAINATIAPNGIKGITAESLRNLLIMMVENAGEGGSGDGALRVIVPEVMLFGAAIVDAGELSPSSWAAMRPELEASIGGIDLSEYEEAVNASFAHNANVAQQILAKAKEGQGASVVLDQTPYLPAAFSIQLQIMPQIAALYEDFAMCMVQPAGLFMQYMTPTPEGEAEIGMVGEQLMCTLNPLASPISVEQSLHYPSNMLIQLNLDGSLLFEVIESETESGS